jgi:SAM-dependent methyltransferase
MRGQLGLPAEVRSSLGDLKGRRVLHLQCATGESTIELAELGALVTGVDISAEALDVARSRNDTILWVQADVQALPAQFRRERYDLVYTEHGVLTWLQDLDRWAGAIESALRPGGDFLLFEEHPVAVCIDSLGRWREDYFDSSIEVSVGWQHFDLPGEPAREETHERFWRLGQVVTTLARAGLRVKALEEYPARRDDFRRLDPRIPGRFLLHAQKPRE